MPKPMPYQEEGVALIDRFGGRALLADEMGLGKTCQSLLWAKRNNASPVVVVCPASLKLNWQREVLQWAGWQARVLEGRKPPKRKGFGRMDRLLIINFDILKYWIKYLKRLDPQLIIVDECHYIQSPNAQRTKAVKTLCKDVPHVIFLSGTPLTNRPVELWTTLNIINPPGFKSAKSFRIFAWRYSQPQLTPWGWQFKGAKNLKKLHRALKKNCMIRRLKKDVLEQLPEKSRFVVPFDLPNRAEYERAESDFLGWLSEKSLARATRAAKAEQLVKMGALKRLAAQLKMPVLFQWVDDLLQSDDGKLVLFGFHRDILEAVHQRYEKMSVLVNGSVKGKFRQLAVDRFRSSDKTRLFVANFQTAGVGLNLTSAFRLAFAEFAWTPGAHTQAEDRIHRIGQTRGAQCYYLVAQNTIEEDLCKLIQKKQDVLSSTLDGERNGNGLDIFDQLVRRMGRRKRK